MIINFSIYTILIKCAARVGKKMARTPNQMDSREYREMTCGSRGPKAITSTMAPYKTIEKNKKKRKSKMPKKIPQYAWLREIRTMQKSASKCFSMTSVSRFFHEILELENGDSDILVQWESFKH